MQLQAWAAARVLTGSAAGPPEPMWLLAEGDQLLALGSLDAGRYPASLREVHAALERRYARHIPLTDFGDRLLTPAFVDAHTHLALVALRALPAEHATCRNMVEQLFFRHEARLTAADVRAFTRLGAYECLLHGTGLVWDHYYFGEAVAAGMADAGLSAVVAPTLQDRSGPGQGRAEAQLAATEALTTATWRARGIWAAVGPHATDTVSAALWQQAIQLAERQGLPLHAHLAQSPEEYLRAQEERGCSPTAWLERIGALAADLPQVFAHALFCDQADLARLGPRHCLVFCPFSQAIFGFPAPVASWAMRGLRWVVATDCAASNDAMQVQKELRMVAAQVSQRLVFHPNYGDFVRGGSEAEQQARVVAIAGQRQQLRAAHTALTRADALLQTVWERPGSLHPAFRAGSLRPGALANFVVWDRHAPGLWPLHQAQHALAFGQPSQAIYALVVRAEPVGTPGDVGRSLRCSAAYRETVQEATERLQHLRRFLSDSA
ncbi:MAG: amidohydrolase family protein [Polyangiales bacterium]